MATAELVPHQKETARPEPIVATGAGKKWRVVLLALLAIAVLLLFFGNRFATFYTDWLWYKSVGQEVVFSRVYGIRILLFFLFGATTFLLAHYNIWLTERISPPMAITTANQHALYPAGNGKPVGRTIEALSSFRTTLDLLLLAGALAFGIATGVTGQAQWDNCLRFLSPVEFGEKDPVFGRDLSFYIFTLPFIRYIQTWLVIILLIVGLGTALVYVYQQGINIASGHSEVGPRVRAHLSALAALTLLAAAWGYYLDRFDLLFGDGRFPGAGYTDIHSRLPANYLLMMVTGLVAVAAAFNIWRRSVVLPGVALGLWLLFFCGNLIVPYFQQRLRVLPNEATREMEYIKRAIQATRAAYDLNSIRVESITPDTSIRAGDFQRFPTTLGNVRLWENDILMRYLMQRQADRQYYQFSNISADRYYLGDNPVHVAVAIREFAPDRLEGNALSWQNLHLRYTHGYGAVVARLGKVGTDGTPDLLVKGLPPVAAYPDLEIKQPQIYYGVSRAHDSYVVIGSKINEFEYPYDSQPAANPTPSDEHRGIPLTPLNRFSFALRLATWSILLSQDITSKSEILLQRIVPVRIKRLAPFLILDREPYAVIANGRLIWVVDGYTSAATYPYSAFSQLHDGLSPPVRFNYIRGAVKATVDAYDGTTHFYAVEDDDPLLRSYQKTFPGLIEPTSAMPAAIRLHQRYPKGLFAIQRRLLTTYHVEDPSVFYAQADTWSVPRSANAAPDASDDDREMPAEYSLCRLPGEKRAEYTLLSPMNPRSRESMSALLVARCDGERYGERILYQYPNAELPPGPQQALRRIRSDDAVRPFLFTMNQRGSRVLFGQVRTVPVERALINVLPLYVQTDDPDADSQTRETNFPELRQVAVLVGDTVVMQPTLEAALNELTAGTGKDEPPTKDGSSDSQLVTRLTEQAVKQYDAAQAALRAGDFARYGAESHALGETLARLRKAAQNSTVTLPSDSGGTGATGGKNR